VQGPEFKPQQHKKKKKKIQTMGLNLTDAMARKYPQR
jgi:hypothetical protein